MKNVHAIRCDRFDVVHYEDVRNQSKRLLALMDRAEEEGEHTFLPLLQDLYDALYQHAPEVVDVDEAYEVNKMALEELIKTSEYRELHTTTRLDVFGSAIGTVSLGEKAFEVVKKMREELEEAAKRLQLAVKGAQENPGDPNAQKEKKAADEHMKKLRSLLRQQMRRAADEAQREVGDGEAAQGFMRGFEDADASEMPLSEQFEFAEKMRKDTELQELARRLGRIEIIAQQAQKTKMEYVSGETANIELGRDLARLLPSEMVKLLSPELRKDWKRRYAEGTLMQYRLVSQEPVGRGPVVVCVDESGSMGGPRILWAKAVALGLAKIAAQQHRGFVYIPFSVRAEAMEYPKGVTPEGMLAIAKHFYGAGTEFTPPLNEAIKVLNESEFDKGDLVFLTDGAGDVSGTMFEWMMNTKRERKFRAVGILVGGDARWGEYRADLGLMWDESLKVNFEEDGAALTHEDQNAVSVVFST